jgi:hypothetical protein
VGEALLDVLGVGVHQAREGLGPMVELAYGPAEGGLE